MIDFATLMNWTTRAIEVAGVAVIVVGIAAASVTFLSRRMREPPDRSNFHHFRASIGRAILLGLEFLVAADIINTVAIEPTLESVMVLGGIVAIRTFLSFSLEVEIEGRWPWRRRPEADPGTRDPSRAGGKGAQPPSPGP